METDPKVQGVYEQSAAVAAKPCSPRGTFDVGRATSDEI